MAILNFARPGYYTRIVKLNLDLKNSTIYFVIETTDGKDGEKVLPDMTFMLDRSEQIREYEKENSIYPDPPEYPSLCKDREAMVPMWDNSSTKEEINEYKAAKQKYEDDSIAYKSNCDNLSSSIKASAETDNVYDQHFGDIEMFDTSNPIQCAYNYLKSKDSFKGTLDE